MLLGQTDGLSEVESSKDHLLAAPESEFYDEDEERILHAASFEELVKNHIKYDTVIWVSISLLLVLAWGVGIIMLLCLPLRRYMLRKDISSRKLYVTTNEIVYKVSRPSWIPFCQVTTIEKRVPLSMVIDIIIEQGWLQSVYGIHTFRVESITHGRAAPVDELQVQGIANPGLLSKVIITEASKNVQEVGKSWKPTLTGEGESVSTMGSLSEGPAVFKSPSKSWKVTGSTHHTLMGHRGSPRQTSTEHRAVIPGEMLLNKLEEVSVSIKKIESLVDKSQAFPESS